MNEESAKKKKKTSKAAAGSAPKPRGRPPTKKKEDEPEPDPEPEVVTLASEEEDEVTETTDRTRLILTEESLLDEPSYLVLGQKKELCEVCGRYFPNKHVLKGHVKNFHHVPDLPSDGGYSGQKCGFVCRLCECNFLTEIELFEHVCKTLQNLKSVLQFDFFLNERCVHCKKKFWNDKDLKLHCILSGHAFELYTCTHCERRYTLLSTYNRHQRRCRQSKELGAFLPIQRGGGWDVENLIENAASIHSLQIQAQEFSDPDLLLIMSKEDIVNILLSELSAKIQIKFKLDLQVSFEREVGEEKQETTAWFGSGFIQILSSEDIVPAVEKCIPHILSRIPDFNNNGSSWSVSYVKGLVLKVAAYNPIRGGCKGILPLWVKRTRAVVNLNCELNDCFPLHILYKILNVQSNKGERTVKFLRKHMHLLNMTDLKLPLAMKDITKFEGLNPTISVNCYYSASMAENEISVRKLLPLRVSEKRNLNHIDLLVVPSPGNLSELERSLFNRTFSDESTTEAAASSKSQIKAGLNKAFHYCLINNLSRLIHPLKESNHKTYICRRCLSSFITKTTFEQHEGDCSLIQAQRIQLPKPPNNFMQFSKHKALLKPWFVCYGDFETLLIPKDKPNITMEKSSSTKVNIHFPFAYAFTVVDSMGKCVLKCNPRIFGEGTHAGVEFLKELREVYETVLLPKMQERPLQMTDAETERHNHSEFCELCECKFENNKTAHHDHKTGQYLGAYCNSCNLKAQQSPNVIVIFHNSKGFDTHILFQGLPKVAKSDDQVYIIPQTREKYIGFRWNSFMFLDSLSFLSCSLEKLGENLDTQQLTYLYDHFQDDEQRDEKVQLLRRKGVFPYSYLSSHAVLDETTLPSIDKFYNDLSQERCSESDYEHAKTVFRVFQCQNLRDYCRIYLTSDILLLCCAFEEFRKMTFSYYGLEATGFFTLPGFAFEAALKMTREKLELLTDPQMYLMIESGIIGGVSMSNCRYLKANNRECADYDPSKPSMYIQYYDVNNLYGICQSSKLPHSNFQWMSEQEKLDFDITKVTPADETGFILEVMLYTPPDAALHEKLADLPPAPLHDTVKYEQLSPWQQNHPNCKLESNQKLILDLRPEKKCVLHALTLQTYCDLGLTFKILRGISFDQKNWLKPFIDFNTSKRKQAKNDFEKSLFKLMNNATFGKFIESQRNRREVRMALTKRRFITLVSKPNFHDFSAFDKAFIAVELKKTSVTLDRPIHCGFTTLCISKAFMYTMFYKVLRPMFNGKFFLAYTDTDAYIAAVYTDSVTEMVRPYAEMYFDFSNLDKNHELFSCKNATEMGFLKCEAKGKIISEFISLKSKMYCLTIEGKQKAVAKGVHRSALTHQVKRDHYYNALFSDPSSSSQHRVSFNTLRSDGLHEIHTVKQVKLGMTSYDDKRKILDNKIDSVPFYFCGDENKMKMSNRVCK